MGSGYIWGIGSTFVVMNGVRYYIYFLRHVLTAKTRHGTHSPFVYRLVDEVLYANHSPGEPRDKIRRLEARLIDRFKPQRINYTDFGLPEGQLDFVVARGGDATLLTDSLSQHWPQFHGGSVLVVEGLYRHAEMRQLWNSIRTWAGVTVTVDLFHVGLVFFHTGQATEHFRIRY